MLTLLKLDYHSVYLSFSYYYQILTTAHCIDSHVKFEQLSILVGVTLLSSAGVRVYPAQLIPNEKYDETFPYIYDIALIKLHSSLNFTELVAPIDLLEYEPNYGAIYEFTGWGWTSIEGEKPDSLHSINLTSIHPAECKNRYNIDGGPGQVCTISPRGSGPCVNDSGGPVTFQGKLFGIDSYGNSDLCDGEKPDITTSVPFHFGWIRDKLQNKS